MAKPEDCPIVKTIRAIGKKWHLIVIRYLMDGSKRFNELKELMNPVSSRTLSATLSELQAVGIVERAVRADPPLAVYYSLTDKGKELVKVLEEMQRWGEKWVAETSLLQPAYEAKKPREL